MKLYYMPGACSLAPHIVANEAGLTLSTVKVDGKTKQTENGDDYLATNPNGYVPALVLDEGQVLSEVQVLLQYIADRRPESGLMPAAGDNARYRAQQWLSYISSELHKSFSPFFKPGIGDETKGAYRELIEKRLAYVDGALEGRSYLMGESFTAPDAYLWTVLRWLPAAGVDLAAYGNLKSYFDRVAARPAVAKTLQQEGLA